MAGRNSEALAIAVDLGGTRFRVAAVRRDGTVLARTQGSSREPRPDAVIAEISRAISAIRQKVAGRPILGLGLAAAGAVDPALGVVVHSPNLAGWRNVPLASRLEAAQGLPTLLGNDANLAALGEARFGAGQGARHLVYLTVSTGIGSGVIVDGALLVGERGAAAEAGHTTIWWDGRLCACGNRGCLEAYASGRALVERAVEAMQAGRPSTLARYLPGGFEAEEVAQEAEAGDGLAAELVREAGIALGLGVRNLLHLFDPAIVVIGGGVSRIGPRLWDPMWETVRADTLGDFRQRARIVPAALGDDPGLLGAASLVFDQLGASSGAGP